MCPGLLLPSLVVCMQYRNPATVTYEVIPDNFCRLLVLRTDCLVKYLT